MIDLRETRQNLLAAIGASDAEDVPRLTDPLANAFYTAAHVHLDVVGHRRDDLFPVLKVALAARFAAVAPVVLTRDLLAPFKNALGNAYKRGNDRDRTKSIAVAIDITRHGVVLAVTDQGAGFDVAATLQRYRNQDPYFQNIGAGFRVFDRSRASVTFADAGRTFLLGFRVEDAAAAGALPGPDCAQRLRAALEAPDSILATHISRPDPAGARGFAIEDLRLFPATVHDAVLRCVVRCRVGGDVVTTVLSGHRYDSAAAARHDFDTGRVLHTCLVPEKVRIPQPIACLESDGIVFTAFDPWMDLWTYADQRGERGALRRLGEHLGACLRILHRDAPADLAARTEDWPTVTEGWEHIGARAMHVVAAMLPERGVEAADLVAALLRRARRVAPPAAVLIHGDFGADTVHYGADGRFYLSRFDRCRRAHPGLDVGNALADLLLLSRATAGATVPPADDDIHAAFMRSYLANDMPPWIEQIPLFVLAALLTRIARARAWSQADVRTALELGRGTGVA